MVFLGSHSGDSQLLQLLASPDTGDSQPGGRLQLEMRDRAFIDSPAPIHTAVLLEEPVGEM